MNAVSDIFCGVSVMKKTFVFTFCLTGFMLIAGNVTGSVTTSDEKPLNTDKQEEEELNNISYQILADQIEGDERDVFEKDNK